MILKNNIVQLIIYKVTNKINGMVYIGQTIKSLNNRKIKHETTNSESAYFSNALHKYSKENFKWEILEYCDSKEELDEMEFHYIKQYDSKRPNGYNLTDGGEGSWGYKHSTNSINKMSGNRPSVQGENNPNFGKTGVWKNKKFSKEHRENIGNSLKDRKFSADTIQKMSDTKKGSKSPNWGKNFSEEHKMKLSLSTKGKKRKNFKLCPYCNRSIDVQNYAKWHGNKCKHKERSSKKYV